MSNDVCEKIKAQFDVVRLDLSDNPFLWRENDGRWYTEDLTVSDCYVNVFIVTKKEGLNLNEHKHRWDSVERLP